MTASEQSSR